MCLQVRCREGLAIVPQTAWCLEQVQVAFPAKSFQANTAKLGTAGRPGIRTFRLLRDVSSLYEIIPKPKYSGVYLRGWIMILEPQACIIVDPPPEEIIPGKIFQQKLFHYLVDTLEKFFLIPPEGWMDRWMEG